MPNQNFSLLTPGDPDWVPRVLSDAEYDRLDIRQKLSYARAMSGPSESDKKQARLAEERRRAAAKAAPRPRAPQAPILGGWSI